MQRGDASDLQSGGGVVGAAGWGFMLGL